jgi:C4-dicarboxylate-specific signal transduction histidine kinase
MATAESNAPSERRDVVRRSEVGRLQVSHRYRDERLAAALERSVARATDQGRLEQVRDLNLVLNGFDAMQAVTDRPCVWRIRAQPHATGHVLVAVQDAGVWLDPPSLARLFEPF